MDGIIIIHVVSEMTKQKGVHKLLIRGENKPRLATEGEKVKIEFYFKNIGDFTFPGGELLIYYFPVALGSTNTKIRGTIKITKRIEQNEELRIPAGEIIPIASGYTMFLIEDAKAIDKAPVHILEINNQQCFPHKGREAQVFHSVRAQTHEEISQRQSVYIAVFSLVVVAAFEVFNLVLNYFQYLNP
jgi:hypothetical protein